MAKPTARAPRASLAAVADAPSSTPPAKKLAPAPDNGVAYADRKPAAETSSGRRGRQLGHRIPDALYERLVACAEETGITQQRLIIRALETELSARGH